MFSNELNLRSPPATDRETQLNATHAQLVEKLRLIAFIETCQFLTIQSLEFQEIWLKTSLEPKWMIYLEKSEFWHSEFLILQKTIYKQITKIAYVKILLEQCLQKGFHVNSQWANDEENLMTGFSLNKLKPFFKPSF